MHFQTSQLDKDLEDEPNKPLPPPKTTLLELLVIDIKLCNIPNFLEIANKPLS